jgi:hypothetical protein
VENRININCSEKGTIQKIEHVFPTTHTLKKVGIRFQIASNQVPTKKKKKPPKAHNQFQAIKKNPNQRRKIQIQLITRQFVQETKKKQVTDLGKVEQELGSN